MMKNKTKSSHRIVPAFYSGTSGLKLDIPKYLFPHPYKDASRLTYYSTLFNSLEVNSSFYKIPLANTVAKWSDSVHENFKLTFKLWKGITHIKGLDFQKTDVDLFMQSIAPARNRKGCLLIQLPPSSTKENLPALTKLLKYIRKQDKLAWNIAVEFRNKSWYSEKVYVLLNFYKASLVIHDIPKSATPFIQHTSGVVYIRFHGPTGNYRDSYSESFLSEYAGYIDEWMGEGKTVYAYFNNTMGDAFKNLQTLNALVGKEY